MGNKKKIRRKSRRKRAKEEKRRSKSFGTVMTGLHNHADQNKIR